MELELHGYFTEQDACNFMRKCNLDPDEWTLEDTHFGPRGGRWGAKHKTTPNFRGSFFWFGSDTYGYYTDKPLR